jgi:hypothetical protein
MASSRQSANRQAQQKKKKQNKQTLFLCAYKEQKLQGRSWTDA